MFWGPSPALDLTGLLEGESLRSGGEMKMLVVGAADARHVLQTMAKSYYGPRAGLTIHFYAVELAPELVARWMLQLVVALEPPRVLGPREKARAWMELYANTLLRASTGRYLRRKAAQLVYILTDAEYRERRMPLLRLDYTKYRERDFLEDVFAYWRDAHFPADALWDERLRRSLGTRYDSRIGVFDWDYHMKLADVPGCKIINSGEYKNWRSTGVAFSWLETVATVGNPSLAAGISRSGSTLRHAGHYVGDARSGPYFSFGLKCEDEEMLKTRDSGHVKRATDVTERNLTRLFHELQEREEYRPTGEEPDFGTVVLEVGQTVNRERLPEEPIPAREEYGAIPTPHRVFFLPTRSLEELPRKNSFRDFFHLIYIAHNVFELVKPEFFNVAAPGAILLVESKKYVVGLGKDDINLYTIQMKTLLDKCGFELIGNYDGLKDDFALFRKM